MSLSTLCKLFWSAATVLPGVTSGSSCYTMNTPFPHCELMSLYYGLTPGGPDHYYKASCTAFDCDTTGVNCTNGNGGGGPLYTCDNYEHPSQIASDSATHAYVCNCRGAATIPSIYTGTGQDGQGKGCGTTTGGGGRGGDTRGSKVDTTPNAASTLSAAAAGTCVRRELHRVRDISALSRC
ncbi:hypothetical protein PG994_006836 [Apiospora phragmitis]|uniref:Uncharacterized protein n=1 Tax=Apiospora phragmitis TaxID=2905665 RepID=A0ABR1VJ26_9PEZI